MNFSWMNVNMDEQHVYAVHRALRYYESSYADRRAAIKTEPVPCFSFLGVGFVTICGGWCTSTARRRCHGRKAGRALKPGV